MSSQKQPKPTIPPPRKNLDPTEWRMYCDLLQDADAPQEEWQRAGRIAEGLQRDPKLVLVNYCPADPLGGTQSNHHLRVGFTWFIGAELTVIESNQLVWWRLEWVRAGFERYPSTDRDRDVEKLIGWNYGTPWELSHPRFHLLQKKRRQLVAKFFDGHAFAELPAEFE